MILLGTRAVRADEPCWRLDEANLHTPDHKAVHRYQVLHVARNDRLVEYREDLGDVSLFPYAKQFILLGGEIVGGKGHGHVYETVGNMVQMAEAMRNRTKQEWDELYAGAGWTQDPNLPSIDFATAYAEHSERS